MSTDLMMEALRVIVGGSPAAGREAMQAIKALHAGSPIVQSRYNRAVSTALSDPEAQFTPEERRLLAGAVAGEGGDTRRERVLHIRLTEDEHARLTDAADAAGQAVSVYVRARLFG